jgi:hypothetical protein
MTVDSGPVRVRLPLTGGCLCGACRYALHAAPYFVYVCHCTDCQRQSGSAYGMSMPAPKDAFSLTLGEPSRFERTLPSGARSVVRFCGTCGSRVFAEGLASVVVIRPGTLDDRSWVRPVSQSFVRSAMPWACIEGVHAYDAGPDSYRDVAQRWQSMGVEFVHEEGAQPDRS